MICAKMQAYVPIASITEFHLDLESQPLLKSKRRVALPMIVIANATMIV